MSLKKNYKSTSRIRAVIAVTIGISIVLISLGSHVTWGATKMVVSQVASSSSAVMSALGSPNTTDATTTVAIPTATSTLFNIYTRPTTPTGVLTALLSLLAIVGIGTGVYLVAKQTRSSKF